MPEDDIDHTIGKDALEALRGNHIDKVMGEIQKFWSYDMRYALMLRMNDVIRGVGEQLPRANIQVGPTRTEYSHQGNVLDEGVRQLLHAKLPSLLDGHPDPYAIRYEHSKLVQWYLGGSEKADAGSLNKGWVLSAEADGSSNLAIAMAMHQLNGCRGDFYAESALTLTLCHSDNPFFPAIVTIYDFDRHRVHSAFMVEGQYQGFVDGQPVPPKDFERYVRVALQSVENPRLYVADYVNDFHQRWGDIASCLDQYRLATGRRIEVKSGTQSTEINGLRVLYCDTIGAFDSRAATVVPKEELKPGQAEALEDPKHLGPGYRLAVLKLDDALPIATVSEAFGCPVESVNKLPLWYEFGGRVDLLNPKGTNPITMAQIWPQVDEGLPPGSKKLTDFLYDSVQVSRTSFDEMLLKIGHTDTHGQP